MQHVSNERETEEMCDSLLLHIDSLKSELLELKSLSNSDEKDTTNENLNYLSECQLCMEFEVIRSFVDYD